MTEHTTKKNELDQIHDQHLNKKSQRNRRVNNSAKSNTTKKKNGIKIASKNETKKVTKDLKSHEKKTKFSKQPKPDLEDKVQKLKQFYQKIYFRKWVFIFRSKNHEDVKETRQVDNHNDLNKENVKQDAQNKLHNRKSVKTNKIAQIENNCRCPHRKTVDRIRRPLPKFKFSHIKGAHREKYDNKLLWPVNNILFPPEFDEERDYHEDSPTRKDFLAQVEADNRLSKPKTTTKPSHFENEKLKRKKLTKKGAFELCQRLNLKSASHDTKNANNEMANNKNETNQIAKNANETNQGKNNKQEKRKKVKNDQQIKIKNNDNLKKDTKSKRIAKTRSKSQNPKQSKTEQKKKQTSIDNEQVDNEIIEKKDINTSPIRHYISVDSDDSSDIANIINKNRKILNAKPNDRNIKDERNLDPNDLTELSPDALFDNQNENNDSDSLSQKINQKIENSDSSDNLDDLNKLNPIIEEEDVDSLDEIIGSQNVKNSNKEIKSDNSSNSNQETNSTSNSNQLNNLTKNSNQETNSTSNSNQLNSVTKNSNQETNSTSNQVNTVTKNSNTESQNSITKSSKTEITESKNQSNNSDAVINNEEDSQNDIEQNGVRKLIEIKSEMNDFDGEEFSASSVGVADMIGSTDSDVRLINNAIADQLSSSDTDSLL